MPPVASGSAVKAVLVSAQASLLLTFLVWSISAVLPLGKGKPADWSLTIEDILLGNALLPVLFYERWAWRSKHRHAYWHRWLGRVIVHVYLSFLLVLCGVLSWNTIFSAPWNIVLSGITISLFLLAILLPFISYNLTKQLYVK